MASLCKFSASPALVSAAGFTAKQVTGSSLASRFFFTSSFSAASRRPPMTTPYRPVGSPLSFRTGRTPRPCSRPSCAMLCASSGTSISRPVRRTFRSSGWSLSSGTVNVSLLRVIFVMAKNSVC
jgi:hypothetical protein